MAKPSRLDRPKATHKEARAACYRVLQEMFDLPAVLRGRKPVSALAGVTPIACWIATVVLELRVDILMQNQFGRVAGALYMRDMGVFLRDLGRQAAISMLSTCVQSTKVWFRMRITFAWQEQLQKSLHATYFKSSNFYRQTIRPDKAICDPGQRMTRDIADLVMQLRIFCSSLIDEGLGAIQAVYRVWILLPNQRFVIPVVFAWTVINLNAREIIAPGLQRGMLAAKVTQAPPRPWPRPYDYVGPIYFSGG